MLLEDINNIKLKIDNDDKLLILKLTLSSLEKLNEQILNQKQINQILMTNLKNHHQILARDKRIMEGLYLNLKFLKRYKCLKYLTKILIRYL